jgi:hypothetical protein
MKTNSGTVTDTRRGRAVTATVLIGMLVLAGCDAAQPAGGGGQSPGSPGSVADGTAAAPVTELAVDRSFWHSGFKVTLGTARLLLPEPVVTIEATFQNLNTDHVYSDREPPDPMVLEVGGRAYPEPARDQQDLPDVPLGLSLPGTIAFQADDQFSLAEAVLVVGAPDVRQAVVPLGRPDGLVSLEPRSVTVGGRVDTGADSNLYLTVADGQVRADDPGQWAQAPAGQEYLRLRFSATNDGPGRLTILLGDALTLELPDGVTAGHESGCGNPQVSPDPHSTVTDGEVCFLVPAPATGEYTLIANGYQEGALPFSID